MNKNIAKCTKCYQDVSEPELHWLSIPAYEVAGLYCSVCVMSVLPNSSSPRPKPI